MPPEVYRLLRILTDIPSFELGQTFAITEQVDTNQLATNFAKKHYRTMSIGSLTQQIYGKWLKVFKSYLR